MKEGAILDTLSIMIFLFEFTEDQVHGFVYAKQTLLVGYMLGFNTQTFLKMVVLFFFWLWQNSRQKNLKVKVFGGY